MKSYQRQGSYGAISTDLLHSFTLPVEKKKSVIITKAPSTHWLGLKLTSETTPVGWQHCPWGELIGSVLFRSSTSVGVKNLPVSIAWNTCWNGTLSLPVPCLHHTSQSVSCPVKEPAEDSCCPRASRCPGSLPPLSLGKRGEARC